MKLIKIPQNKLKLKARGRPVIGYRVELDDKFKNLSYDESLQLVRDSALLPMREHALQKNNTELNFRATCYFENGEHRSCHAANVNNDLNLVLDAKYNDDQYYMGDIQRIYIYLSDDVILNTTMGGNYDMNEFNDCFYYACLHSTRREKMNMSVITFKSSLGLERKCEIDLLHRELAEKILKINIIIVFMSECNIVKHETEIKTHKYTATITLENGHYKELILKKPFKNLPNLKYDKHVYLYNDTHYFNGKDIMPKDIMTIKDDNFVHLWVKSKSNKSLEDQYVNYIHSANEIKKVTNNYINPMCFSEPRQLSLLLLSHVCPHLLLDTMIERNETRSNDISELTETYYVRNCVHGGLRYWNKQPKIYNDVYYYDCNEMYIYAMLNITLPHECGKVVHIKLNELKEIFDNENAQVPYGIYNFSCIYQSLENPYMVNHKYLTHYDIMTYRLLGFNLYELIMKYNENNENSIITIDAFIYDKEIRKKEIFTNYVNFFDKLEIKKIENKDVQTKLKIIRNCAWGSLATKNSIYSSCTSDLDISERYIEDIDIEKGNLVYIEKDNYFLYGVEYARYAPFIASYCKYFMIRTFKTNLHDIIYINIDGLYSTKKITNINIHATKRGYFKEEFCAQVKLTNKNICKNLSK
jgi:hypothetical protein